MNYLEALNEVHVWKKKMEQEFDAMFKPERSADGEFKNPDERNDWNSFLVGALTSKLILTIIEKENAQASVNRQV